jgi:hypothetical protein
MTTGFNQRGSFAATDVATGISLIDTAASASENIEGITKAYPGAAFTVTGLFSLPPIASTFNLIGFMAATSTSGKVMLFGVRWNGAWQVTVLNYNSFSSFNAFALAATGIPASPFIWLRYKDDGTNIFFYISMDGIYFNQMYTVSRASSFLGSSGFSLLGLSIDPCNGVVGTVCQSYLLTTP